MKYGLIYGPSAAVLPDNGLGKKIAGMSEYEIKLFVYLCLNSGSASGDRASEELGIPAKELDKAAMSLAGQGLITVDGSSSASGSSSRKKTRLLKDLPVYTGEEFSELVNKNGLMPFFGEIQRILDVNLSRHDYERLLGIYDYYKLDKEYLLMLAIHCSKINKRSVAYLAKTVAALYDENVDTPQKLESKLKNVERAYQMEPRLRKLLGIGERALTPNENKYIEKWVGEWRYSYEITEKAYYITVDNTQKTSMSYMNKVLKNWHDNGYDTREKIENALEEYKRSKQPGGANSDSSFDLHDFFNKALKRSYEQMGKKDEDGSN